MVTMKGNPPARAASPTAICIASPEHRNVEDAANVLRVLRALPKWRKNTQLSYQDRLRIWMAALLKDMAYWNGRGLLITVRQAVEELNVSLDLGRQVRAAQLKRIVAEFKDTSPPYSSFDPRLALASEKRRERAAERAAKHRAYMRDRMREKRSAVEQVPPRFCGSKGMGTRPPEIWAKTTKRSVEFVGKF